MHILGDDPLPHTPYLISPVVHLYVVSIHIDVLIGIIEDSC